ncbi:MAG TPA: tRNA lysidine(34) synthetase TilS [Woeseiaceae bacterium]|nr:tRNA lysidine(34) synthetase TilS [Woeseiaceae bacterium]
MSFTPDTLLASLRQLEALHGRPERYVVALSGGLDSSVLLHALAAKRSEHSRPLAAVHVDHGLHPDSADWALAAEAFAGSLDVAFRCLTVRVAADPGISPEAAARTARYRAFATQIQPGDWLLCAHHQNDQAETLLLNLLRGSGPTGLAAMRAVRDFHGGQLVRPMLGVPRAELHAYATSAQMHWLEDPGNRDERFDRNFLRHSILPLLATHWSDPVARLARSAELNREASQLLGELADADLASLGESPDRLSLTGLNALPRPRAANALRRACERLGLPRPSATGLDSLFADLVAARRDAEPTVRWRGVEARRFRDHLFLLPEMPASDFCGAILTGSNAVALGPGLGRLTLDRTSAPGIQPALVESGLRLKLRQGGEKLKPLGQQHTRKLKKLLQENAVPPWLRKRLPLLYAGDRLVAVADLWMDASAVANEGYIVRWEGRPPFI